MSDETKKLSEYLNNTKFIVLATVNKEQIPVQRSLGSFAADGFTVYFSTHRKSAKVEQIHQNPKVSILFQHENQELISFKNIEIAGEAKELTAQEERDKAIALIGARNPRFKERAEKGELAENTFFRVEPKEIKVLDFAKGLGTNAVRQIDL